MALTAMVRAPRGDDHAGDDREDPEHGEAEGRGVVGREGHEDGERGTRPRPASAVNAGQRRASWATHGSRWTRTTSSTRTSGRERDLQGYATAMSAKRE